MKKVNNIKIGNISRGSIYKIYREKTGIVKEKEEAKKKQLVSRRIRTH